MTNISIFGKNIQEGNTKKRENSLDVEILSNSCKERFNQILSEVLNEKSQEAHKLGGFAATFLELRVILLYTCTYGACHWYQASRHLS